MQVAIIDEDLSKVEIMKLTRELNQGKGDSSDVIGIRNKQDYWVHVFGREFIK